MNFNATGATRNEIGRDFYDQLIYTPTEDESHRAALNNVIPELSNQRSGSVVRNNAIGQPGTSKFPPSFSGSSYQPTNPLDQFYSLPTA